MAKVKGSVFGPRLEYVKKRGTPDQETKILERLSPEFKEDMRRLFMTHQWYPFEYYIELNQAIVSVMGKGNIEFLREVGYFSADHALNSFYKFFFKAGSPEFIIKVATSAWNQYFQNGSLSVDVHEQKRLTMKFEKLEILAKEHFVSTAGWVQRVLELSGAKGVTINIGKFEPSLVTLEVSWNS